ncbi:MAG: hypothetical protein GY865_01205, partial [candidate division Zixibacteria bacterium]|nr:hypothetical protein [candidate division Zixibacteria bacterium]
MKLKLTSSVMCFIILVAMVPQDSIANEKFQVSGQGTNSTYSIRIEVDGSILELNNVAANPDMGPEDFVSYWKEWWDFSNPQGKFVIDPTDPTKFTLIGANISVIVDGTEVVGNQNGVPFNPTIYWLGTSIPTLPEWGLIILTVLLL